MKPTCKAEAVLAYDFADARTNSNVNYHRDGWRHATSPWMTLGTSCTNTKWLQRVASKARRQAAKQEIAQAILD